MVVQIRSNSHHRQSGKMSDSNQQKVEANILVLGAENVGKSALTVRFLTRRFIGEYGDIESIYTHSGNIDGKEICFSIWDSLYPQNPEVQGCLSGKQLRWADGFILVYSICDRASFNVVRQQAQCIQQAKKMAGNGSGKVPIIIVGNKRDLQHRRTVSSEEGRLLALSTECSFFEISAAETYHSVLLVFHELLDLIRVSRTTARKAVGFKGIVRSMSAVFSRKRTE
ncbi:ras-related and estrogen-regulated growth inhibitor-like protein [Latimeria chalumnae]|uniref:small monomeric GTPase n=1 Tax=Latimeria chalumnae TaxID=7897 RepID=H3BEA9_LATCH|nr:PREDICTED: ras-related and estrogen-regulated growth inhibitor-like protein [Latimeria chalumnae]|eukprot:XP_005991731.1 PREDICTED: ras-related and estrogen-regulated growth inhibitor-like protein [Latimeria chalumnae]